MMLVPVKFKIAFARAVMFQRPYGDLTLGSGRALKVDPAGASRLRVGRGVRVAQGVRAVFRIGPGARLTIPDGKLIAENLEVDLGKGDEFKI